MGRVRDRESFNFLRWFQAANDPAQQTARIAAFLTISIAAFIAIVRWGFKIVLLTSWLPDALNMKLNTAICFILTGIALFMETARSSRTSKRSPRSKAIGQGCAIAATTIGALTLTQYLFGWELGIDQLLVPDIGSSSPHPGRMADSTALNFVLVSVALWLLPQNTRRADRTAQVAAILIAAITLLALTGYIFGVKVFRQFILFSPSMSLPTIITFLILCIGILAASANRGLMQAFTQYSSGRVIARSLIPIAVGLPLVLGWIVLQGLSANLYNPAFALALLVIGLMLLFVAIVWRLTYRLNQQEADLKRAFADQEQLLINEKVARNQATVAEAKLHEVVSSLRDGFYTFDRDWHFTYVNDRLIEIIRRSREAVIGKTIWELFPDLVGTNVEHQLQRAMHDRVAVNFEVYYPPLESWFAHRVYPTADGIAVLVTDVTESNRSQAQLRLYADVVKTTQIGIAVWHLEDINDPSSFRILIANAATGKMMGIDCQSLIGQKAIDCFPGLHETPLIGQYVTVIRSQQGMDLGEVPYADDRRSGIYTIKAFPLPNQCIGLAFEDITQRKQAELNEQFLNDLDRRLRQLPTAEAMMQEALSCLGEYLNVDRVVWDKIDWAAGVAVVEQDWHKQAVSSLVGTYQLSEFVLPDLANLFRSGQPAIVSDVTTVPYRTHLTSFSGCSNVIAKT